MMVRSTGSSRSTAVCNSRSRVRSGLARMRKEAAFGYLSLTCQNKLPRMASPPSPRVSPCLSLIGPSVAPTSPGANANPIYALLCYVVSDWFARSKPGPQSGLLQGVGL